MIARIPDRVFAANNEVLTSAEVAELLKVHLSSVRRWSRSGKLKGYRLGGEGDWRFLRQDVLSFLYSYSSIGRGGESI
jgi:excisionase family DNA binding protein